MAGKQSTPELLSRRLYRWMLRAYPARIRERDSDGMLYAFTRQLSEARARGKLSAAAFWTRSSLHALFFGLCERIHGLGRKDQSRSFTYGRGEGGRLTEWPGKMSREVRHAARFLIRRPTVAATAIVSLGLGIGTSTAVFCLVHQVLIEPLPYPDSDRLVGVWHTDPDTPQWGHAHISYLFYRQRARAFGDVGAYRGSLATVSGSDVHEELPAAIVSASALHVLGVVPMLGRSFVDEDESPDAEPTVMLSYRLWTRRFGADPALVGHTIRIDGRSHTVIGVMPEHFQFPSYGAQLWLPMTIDRSSPNRSYWNCALIARLNPGVEIDEAEVEMRLLAGRLPEAFPDPDAAAVTFADIGVTALVHPFKDDVIGDVSVTLWILFAGVGCVLLVACANAANIFLASAEERHHEIVLRTALGANRSTLMITFLSESLLLSFAGGALGVCLAAVSLPTVLAMAPQEFPRLDNVSLSLPVVLFAFGASLLGGVLLGLMPVLTGSRSRYTTLQTSGNRVAGGGRDRYLRNGLAVAQLALALVLMSCSGLMTRSLGNMRRVEPGFEPAGVLTMRIPWPESVRETTAATVAFYEAVLDAVRAVPGVVAAGAADGLPLAGAGDMLGHSFEDFPPTPNEHLPNYRTLFVTPGYIETMRIPIVAGRPFNASDVDAATKAVLVSAPLAARLWPNESAVGKRLTPARIEDTGVWYEIVGVAGPVRFETLERVATETIYYPVRPILFTSNADPLFPDALSLAVRTELPPTALAQPVSAAVWSVAPGLPITRVQAMTDIVAQAGGRTTFSMAMLLIATAVALVLAVTGLYGLFSFIVSRRTREIGIRMALGADGCSVNRMVLTQAVRFAAAGLLLGLAGVMVLGRYLKSMLFEVGTTDPVTLAVVSLLLLAVTLLASYFPARRAARVDPLQALAEP